MKFKTTREDYDKAVKEVLDGNVLDNCCLLAQTIKRVSGLTCRVGLTTAWFKTQEGAALGQIDLPENAREAIGFFDLAFSVKPGGTLEKAVRVFHRDGFKEVEFDLDIESVTRT